MVVQGNAPNHLRTMKRITTLTTTAAISFSTLLVGGGPAHAYQCRYVDAARVCGDSNSYSVQWPNGNYIDGSCGAGVRRRGISFVEANYLHQQVCGERLNP
jgi:hypothetical protein